MRKGTLNLSGKLLLILFACLIVGCSSTKTTTSSYTATIQPAPIRTTKDQGIVDYVWEEPMVDVVDVPPGLDPEGHYYRRGHQSIVEIRQGRWQYYNKDKNY